MIVQASFIPFTVEKTLPFAFNHDHSRSKIFNVLYVTNCTRLHRCICDGESPQALADQRI